MMKIDSNLKKILALSLIYVMFLIGCTENQRKGIKHMKSGLIGLKRVVTLYNCNGNPIKVWIGTFKVELQGGVAAFIDDKGNDVKVSGTYTIEEID